MSGWAPVGAMCSFDVESTGVDVEVDRVVTATVVVIRPGAEPDVRSTVIDPGVPVPEEAAQVHGWTTERVQAEGKPPASELDWIAGDLANALLAGVPLVVANAPFDLTMLDRELRRHQLPTLLDRLDGRPLGPVLDPMVLDKQLDRYRPGRKRLEDLCATYGVRLDGAHDAAQDALAAARVVYRMGQMVQMPKDQLVRRYAKRRFPYEVAAGFTALATLSLAGLHEAQVGWYAEQSCSFADYLRRQARDLELDQSIDDPAEQIAELRHRADNVTTDWPMRPWGGER